MTKTLGPVFGFSRNIEQSMDEVKQGRGVSQVTNGDFARFL
jgi:hypothetical protein